MRAQAATCVKQLQLCCAAGVAQVASPACSLVRCEGPLRLLVQLWISLRVVQPSMQSYKNRFKRSTGTKNLNIMNSCVATYTFSLRVYMWL